MSATTECRLSELKQAHTHCIRNEESLAASELAGCFQCCETYSPSQVHEWVRENCGLRTAVCPRCGIDSVIGSSTGVALTGEFLRAMCDYWFADEE